MHDKEEELGKGLHPVHSGPELPAALGAGGSRLGHDIYRSNKVEHSEQVKRTRSAALAGTERGSGHRHI